MRKYELVIFDFDGTLADTFDWFKVAINKAARKYNFRELNETEMEQLRDKKTREIMSYLGVSWWRMPFIARYMRKLMGEDISHIKLFPGVRELLLYLDSKNVKVIILSSNSRENVERVLGEELLQTIHHLECGISILGKTDKLKKVLRKFQMLPEKVIAVGDETRDIEAARSLRIISGAVSWGYSTPRALENEKPDFIFPDVPSLIHALDF